MTYAERATDLAGARWRKSTRSGGNGGSCVEVAELAEVMAVRDSKDQDGPALLFGRQPWSAFVDSARSGTFEA